MPISSFYGLQTSLRGLLAQQRALDTTSHNIANASTPGYTRQTAVLEATPAMVAAGTTASGLTASLGSGVTVQAYTRVRDQFLDVQYRSQATQLADAKTRADGLANAQLALAEPGENGINQQLSDFWGAWSTLTNATGTTTASAKQSLAAQAQSLTDTIKQVRAQMTAAGTDAMSQYTSITRPASGSDAGGDVAQVASQLAALNTSIAQLTSQGDKPNDLMDQRDLLLDKLAGFGQISVETLASGSTNVAFVDTTTGSTYPIVSDQTASWAGPPAGNAWSPSGQLGGLLKVGGTGGSVAGFVADLDTLAANLASSVNAAYGGSFFTVGTSAQAASIGLASGLASNPTSITAGSGAAGSNDIALAVSRLRGSAGVDQAYSAFVSKVGATVQQAQTQQSTAQSLVDSVEDRRQSVSGVSLDEEMTNMIRYQRAYQASARAMSTMDDMLDVLINRTGRVGL